MEKNFLNKSCTVSRVFQCRKEKNLKKFFFIKIVKQKKIKKFFSSQHCSILDDLYSKDDF